MSKKKVKDEVSVEEEKVTEKVVEKKESVDSMNTIIDKHGFTWKVDKDGNKIKRL
tara:strand:+ start:162 stop:326 length:165 start_codon:yes stop_codon:yes gene_type:complete